LCSLKSITVRYLQTLEKSYFLHQDWLAVEKSDGQIERLLPIAGDDQKRKFSCLLSKKASHSLSEGHLCFSIFSRPASNRFTRVQRCTCCFIPLFTSMFLNILYYDQAKAAEERSGSTSLSFGTFFITTEQVRQSIDRSIDRDEEERCSPVFQMVIGFIVEFLSFSPNVLLIQFFRRTRNRHRT
jgi:polycystin 1L2